MFAIILLYNFYLKRKAPGTKLFSPNNQILVPAHPINPLKSENLQVPPEI